MGEAELLQKTGMLVIRSVIYFYGDASSESLAELISRQISDHWNEPEADVQLKTGIYRVHFNITGIHKPDIQPEEVWYNDVPSNNYFRIEEFAGGNISFVDGLGCNTGYFKLDNLLNHPTTAAHEYGHTLGLDHPKVLDIRGRGVPRIMSPRGTIVDPPFQYSPVARPLEPGGTINPFTRKVLQSDIDGLKLNRLRFNKEGFAVLGDFSSV